MLLIVGGLMTGIGCILYVVYRAAYRKTKEIVGIG